MDEDLMREVYRQMAPHLDERQCRLLAGSFAAAGGHGGVTASCRATGLSHPVVRKGRTEVGEGPLQDAGGGRRVRRSGGGRKSATVLDPTLKTALEELVDPESRGDPQSPLRWTCKSTRRLADELTARGHRVSHTVVAQLLNECGYSLQANRKTREGGDHPDRDGQFQYINATVTQFMEDRQPVISVDTKKKELVGDFRNGGCEWQPQGEPEEVRVHDFVIPELGRASPYGVYDLKLNLGWVNVGCDHDTSAFAVESIRRWWYGMGQECYPDADRLLITADGGGSNGSRARLWKRELQGLADETGMAITVRHFPPGTSKWNRIEHRLFSFITQNWRGRPLLSYLTIVSLIGATTNRSGLRVHCELDTNSYPQGIRVTDAEMNDLHLGREEFHGEWNYTISPGRRQ